MQDLDTLIPTGVQVLAAGELISISPLKVGQLPAFLRAIRSVMGALAQSEVNWLEVLGTHGEPLLDALGIALGKPRAWVDDLAADEAIDLTAKVIEVNADFLTRTVLPRLEGLFAQTRATTQQVAGSTPSSA